MSREFLMLILALDLLVMGASGYVVWDRARAKAPPPKALRPPRPPPEPAPAEPAPAPAPSTPTVKEATPPARSSAARNILFQYRDSVPKRVAIAGDFNDWSPQLMKKDKNYLWKIALLLEPGEYAYNFIVDGKMIRDPSNRDSTDAGRKIPSSLLKVRPR